MKSFPIFDFEKSSGKQSVKKKRFFSLINKTAFFCKRCETTLESDGLYNEKNKCRVCLKKKFEYQFCKVSFCQN